MSNKYLFKVASDDWEFKQIHKLNYETFVQEIPQHQSNHDEKLIDKFHEENTYMICLRNCNLVGMVAIKNQRPFSLDYKLTDLDSYLPIHDSPCEVRLLSIDKNHRYSKILKGLLILLIEYFDKHHHDLVLISAVINQMKLYKHIGFVPFGNVVGTKEARFQPMYLTLEGVRKLKRMLGVSREILPAQLPSVDRKVNLLPGPVGIHDDVRQRFSEDPVSHRSSQFVEDFRKVKSLLCKLVNTQNVEILMGSGTLANDAIAAQVSLLNKKGLIMVNGEFGERLIDHAARFGLSFATLKTDWGAAFSRNDIEHAIKHTKECGWIWCVHCESSTGVLNDIVMVKELCAKHDIKLCVDCVSSIGVVPMDLHDVYLASAVSGKGIGSLPGLSMVFYNHHINPVHNGIPRYLDLGLYHLNKGIPFTISSNMIYALKNALERLLSGKRFDEIKALSTWVKVRLTELGIKIIASDGYTSPAIITFTLDRKLNSENIGQRLETAGYYLSYRSEYLLKRNWIQICLMGEYQKEKIIPLFDILRELIGT